MRCLVCLLALLAFALPSCGGGDTHEKVSEEMIDLMAEVADILEGVTDEESAEAATTRLEKLGERAEELGQRAEALGDPDPEEEKRLEKKYEQRMQEISKSMAASMMRLSSQPEVLQAVEEAMAKIE